MELTSPETTDVAGDLLIVAAGFEDRAIAGAVRLGKSLARFSGVVLVQYTAGLPGNDAHYDQLNRLLKEQGAAVEGTIVIDRSKPVLAHRQLREGIANVVARKQPRRAWLDISGLSSLLIVTGLHELRRLHVPVSILYSEADEYLPKQSEYERVKTDSDQHFELSEALLQSATLSGLYILPDFAGSTRANKPACLFEFAGFEPHRATGLIDDYAPAAVVVFYGRSPYEDLAWRTKMSRDLHRGLFSRWHVREAETSTLQVEQILSDLEAQFAVLRASYDIAIAPQCSKMQVVATYLFWLRHPEVQLIFTSPAAYTRHPAGFRRTYQLDLA